MMMPASLLPNTLPPSNSEGFSDDSNLTLLAQHQLLHLRELRQAADSVAVQPRKLQSAPHDRPFDRIGHPPSQGVEGRAGDIPARTAASSGTWPASGARIFVIMRMMVLLPAPLRPSRAGESGPGVGDLLAIRHDNRQCTPARHAPHDTEDPRRGAAMALAHAARLSQRPCSPMRAAAIVVTPYSETVGRRLMWIAGNSTERRAMDSSIGIVNIPLATIDSESPTLDSWRSVYAL